MKSRYQRIQQLHPHHSVRALCLALDVHRASYYAWRKREPSRRSQEDAQLMEILRAEHQFSRHTYGRPRLCEVLRRQGRHHSSKRIARLMRRAGLIARKPKLFRPRTTDSNHSGPIAPNRLSKHGRVSEPDRVWVTDLTYVQTAEGWLYVSAIMDLYSRRIVGWAFADHLQTTLPLQALTMALRHRRPAAGLIHHSDRGCQYASADYRRSLGQHGLNPSMSRAANCYDNAAMESFWSTLKLELIYRRAFLTKAEAQSAIFDYIETFYNRERFHSALGYKSPVDFETKNN
jgi:transposase InsO family protein